MHDDKLAEEIDRLYESFLHTGDLEHFYECLKLACGNDTVSQTAIELIKTRFVDDAEGKPAIIVANYNQSDDAGKQLQYDLLRSRGLSEGKIWRALATIYGGNPESHKKRLKRKFKTDSKG